MGGAGSRRLKNPHGCKALPEGTNPETAARQAGLALLAAETMPGQRYVGSSQPKGCWGLLEGETSEG